MLTRKQLEDASKCVYHGCGECSIPDMGEWVADTVCTTMTAQTALTLLDMVKSLEWKGKAPWGKDAECCPMCGQYKQDGHKPNCELGNILKEVER